MSSIFWYYEPCDIVLNMNMNPDFEKLHMSARTLSSPAELVGDKFAKKAIAAGIDLSSLTTDEAIQLALKNSRLLKGPFATVDLAEVIKFLRDEKLVPTLEEVKARQKAAEKALEQKVEPEPEPEFIPIQTGIGLVEIENDSLAQNLESAKKIQEIKEVRKKEQAVLGSDEGLDELYEQVVTLQEGRDVETSDYYDEFLAVGYTSEEIAADVADLHKIEEDFARRDSGSGKKSKKIATLTEVALERGVSGAGWYGDRVKIQPTSKFDDIKRGIDGVLEITEEGNDSKFLGLGIDVTFGGESSYQIKRQKLLDGIQRGHVAKIKYFKDHKGVPQKEFIVPKIILSFSLGDVRNLISCLGGMGTEEGKKKFRDNPIKTQILRQIIDQCENLSEYARKYDNPIYKQYDAISGTIRGLSEDYPEIREALADSRIAA